MTETMNHLARTGRSTALLREAIELARHGRHVHILYPDERTAITAERQTFPALFTRADGHPRVLGIRFEWPESLPTFDFRTFKLPGAHPDTVVLVDHRTIEAHFAGLVDALHRHDPDPLAAVRDALQPVIDWFQSDEEHPRDPLDILREAVATLQNDREDILRLEKDRRRLDFFDARSRAAEVQGGPEDGHQSKAWAIAAHSGSLRDALDGWMLAEQSQTQGAS